jgi:phosphatidylglycerophosphatase A
MSVVDRLRWLLITSGGLGLAPVAPGTFGTLGGVLLAVVLQASVAPGALGPWLAGTALVLLAFGCTQGAFSKRVFQCEDPGPFVLDEVVGYLVTVAIVTFVRHGPPTPWQHAAAFLAFRACDVVKPPPARRLEELPGGPGIMLDDFAAGIYAGLITCGLAWMGVR